MQFKDIEGQRVLINHLTEIIDSGRVSHAQMFLGPTTGGSLALAIAYAQYLNCEHRQHHTPGADGQFMTADGQPTDLRADACGQCPSCRKYQQLMHTDLHFIFPSISTSSVQKPCASEFQGEFRQFLLEGQQIKTEKEWYEMLGDEKQGMIRERDADDICRTLSLKAYESGYKVVIIWMAERMNTVTANKLLKNLEEPTDRTLILLVAENRDRMLSTIISRVQQIVVPGQNTVLSDSSSQEFGTLFVSWMRLLFKLNMKPLSDWVDETAKQGREKNKQFLQYTHEALRVCFLNTAAGIPMEGISFGDPKFDAAFPSRMTLRNIEKVDEAFNDAIMAIERNANAKITFMQLSFTMSRLIKNC